MTSDKKKRLVKKSYWISVDLAAKVTKESKRVKESESAIMRKIIDASGI